MLAFSIDYYGIFFRATQSVELFCTYVTPADLRNMSEENVIELMIFTDRDRKDNEDAEKLYWWCIQEINFRMDLSGSEYEQ